MFLKLAIEASQQREYIVEQIIKPKDLPKPPNYKVSYSKDNSFRNLFDEEKT